jgi:hypothetical protein
MIDVRLWCRPRGCCGLTRPRGSTKPHAGQTRSTIDDVTRYYVYTANDERLGRVEVSPGTRRAITSIPSTTAATCTSTPAS